MSCNRCGRNDGCNQNLKGFGVDDISRIVIDGRNHTHRNWTEVSVPELVDIPPQKPDIEQLDQVYVNGKVTAVKLIETPFAYQVYQRPATAYELTAAKGALALAVVDITPIIKAVNVILAIPGLPAIPAVAALQAALAAVTVAAANLTSVIAEAKVALDSPCPSASLLVALLEQVNGAIALLVAALNALITAAIALVTATAAIPVVGAAVAAAVTALKAAIHAVLTSLATATKALLGVITLVGHTTYFGLIANEEGTLLTGRKLVVEGVLHQKVVYTGLVATQSVHSVHNDMPFTAYIIPYASFQGLAYGENITVFDPNSTVACATIQINGWPYDPTKPPVVELCEEFCVESYVEDIFAYAVDCRTVFKNITIFLLATPGTLCD